MYVLFVLYIFVILFFSHFGFEGSTLVLIAQVPGHCLPFTWHTFLTELIKRSLVELLMPYIFTDTNIQICKV